MSIQITYPTPDTMRIQCGDDIVEVPIHAGMRAEAPTPAPPSTAVPPSPPVTEPEPEVKPSIGSYPSRPPLPWPKPPPGVMGIVNIRSPGGRRGIGPLLQHWDWDPDLGDLHVKIADLQASTMLADVRKRVQAMRSRAGIAIKPLVLNVEIRPNKMTRAIDVGELRTLVQEPSLGLDGIRLMFMPGDEPV